MSIVCSAKPREDDDGSGCWASQHRRFCLKAGEREPDAIFIGDGIIQLLQFTELWRKHFEPLHCLNFGVRGDRIENVLWRIEHGELDDCKPKAVVLHVGANNPESVEHVVVNLLNLVNLILDKAKSAQVIVLGMLPVGEAPNTARVKRRSINQSLRMSLRELRGVVYIEPDWETFLAPADGTLSHRDLYDYRLPTEQGYRKLCEPQLVEELQSALGTFLHTSGVEETSDSDCPL